MENVQHEADPFKDSSFIYLRGKCAESSWELGRCWYEILCCFDVKSQKMEQVSKNNHKLVLDGISEPGSVLVLLCTARWSNLPQEGDDLCGRLRMSRWNKESFVFVRDHKFVVEGRRRDVVFDQGVRWGLQHLRIKLGSVCSICRCFSDILGRQTFAGIWSETQLPSRLWAFLSQRT